ncbi:hypothetical protein LTR66_002282 [Elasticomyces elasticus]|nr:hypothetical protein LTR66_002282 [Elasticomyces elasticus]
MAENAPPVFYVGQHESHRAGPVSGQVLRRAQDAGYDMVTTPITSTAFRSRVITILNQHLQMLSESSSPQDVPLPLITPLSPLDTPLTPDECSSSLLAFTSPWIDLASPDPLVAHLSSQVFYLEIAYAAFCGVNNVIVRGPRLHHNDAATGSGLTRYARAVAEALNMGCYLQLSIQLSLVDDPLLDEEDDLNDDLASLSPIPDDILQDGAGNEEEEADFDLFGTWDAWHLIRSTCSHHSRLSIGKMQYITSILPRPSRVHLERRETFQGNAGLVKSRWYSEPIRLLNISANSFLPNVKGYPVLSKPHQALIIHFARLRAAPWILLSDVGPIPGSDYLHTATYVPGGAATLSPSPMFDASPSSLAPTPSEAAKITSANSKKPKDPVPHLRYIRHLQSQQPLHDAIDHFAAGYQDYLQSPLQPLTDNLESITYEVFEKDPVKYEWYERAVALALMDFLTRQEAGGEAGEPITVAVVGAGRGPLVTRVLRASADTGVAVSVWAVEKNPNAYVLLQRHNATDPLWNNAVTVVKSDMRSWPGPILSDGKLGKVDILVSELLGSFADNELSPECLDGVQHVLSPSGMSIPASYTAHLTPISTPRIHNELMGKSLTDKEAWETPYVVMLHQISYLSTATPTDSSQAIAAPPNVQTCWNFSHPTPSPVLTQANLRRGGSAAGGSGGAMGGDGANEHNRRFCRLKFECKDRGVCHGLAGYFETVLYTSDNGETVELSTNPLTMEEKSKDMIGWFPIFFPLKVRPLLPHTMFSCQVVW